MKGGVFIETKISLSSDDSAIQDERNAFDKALKGKPLHEINDFDALLEACNTVGNKVEVSAVANWLNGMFGKGV